METDIEQIPDFANVSLENDRLHFLPDRFGSELRAGESDTPRIFVFLFR